MYTVQRTITVLREPYDSRVNLLENNESVNLKFYRLHLKNITFVWFSNNLLHFSIKIGKQGHRQNLQIACYNYCVSFHVSIMHIFNETTYISWIELFHNEKVEKDRNNLLNANRSR